MLPSGIKVAALGAEARCAADELQPKLLFAGHARSEVLRFRRPQLLPEDIRFAEANFLQIVLHPTIGSPEGKPLAAEAVLAVRS
jgi:hypothetical protein